MRTLHLPSVCVLLCVSVLLLLHQSSPVECGLYDSDHDMTILDHRILTHALYASERAWLVEFYASWCGHCQNYAKTWRAINRDLADWQGLTVAGIDCGAEENRDICGQYRITGYPTLKYFPPHASVGDEVVITARSVADVRKATLTELMKTNLNPALHPPTDVGSVLALLDSKSRAGAVVCVMDDGDDSSIGPELVMDLSRYNKDLFVTYVRGETMMTVGAKYSITQYPCVLILAPQYSTPKVLFPATSNEKRWSVQMRVQLTSFLDSEHLVQVASNTSAVEAPRVTIAPTPLTYFTSVNARDVANAVTYALKHEVPMQGNLTGERLEALQHFTSSLARYLRLSAESESALYSVSEWVKEKSFISKDMYSAFLDSWRLPEANLNEWVQCKGSRPQYRGYPCGLWSLFHTLTSTATKEDEDLSDKAPRDVILSIKGYVKNFFGCKECAGHFLEVAKSVEAELDGRHHGQAMLWLWQAHNRANIRLGGNPNELSTDPYYPKLVFPPVEICRVCRHKDFSDPIAYSSWDIPSTLKFLLDFYTLTSQVENDSVQMKAAPAGGSSGSDSFISPQLLSFCVLLNICSAIMCCRAYALKRSSMMQQQQQQQQHKGGILPLYQPTPQSTAAKKLYPL